MSFWHGCLFGTNAFNFGLRCGFGWCPTREMVAEGDTLSPILGENVSPQVMIVDQEVHVAIESVGISSDSIRSDSMRSDSIVTVL